MRNRNCEHGFVRGNDVRLKVHGTNTFEYVQYRCVYCGVFDYRERVLVFRKERS